MTPTSRETAVGNRVLIGNIERSIMDECENEEAEMEVDYRLIAVQYGFDSGFSGFSVMVHV